MRRFILNFVCVLGCLPCSISASNACKVLVPKVIVFADLRLKPTSKARVMLQKKVDDLTRCENQFNQLLNRTNLFFPIIEKTLAQENVPDDLKYQALFESGLRGNVVSHTNDVGFWQIHRVAAVDLNLRIGHPIDERMHLVESTRAAARLLKSHKAYFNSWLGALLAYNRGRTGALRVFPKAYRGAKTVQLDEKTDAYIMGVLANKLAFQKFVGKHPHPEWSLLVYDKGHHGQSLSEVASCLKIEEALLKAHNPWLKTAIIPTNTTCSLLVPIPHGKALNGHTAKLQLAKQFIHKSLKLYKDNSVNHAMDRAFVAVDYAKYMKADVVFPIIQSGLQDYPFRIIKANGKLAIIAQTGDSIESLATLMDMDIQKFSQINDILTTDLPVNGQLYFYQKKSGRAAVHFHIVKQGEDLWGISQQYGIKLSALLEKNRLKQVCAVQKGQILWLRFIRPKAVPIAYM